MNSASKHAVVALLVFSITGCAPKNTTTAAPPANAQAPAIPAAGKAGALYPPPLTESQTQTEPAAPPPPPVEAKTEPEPEPEPPPPTTQKSTTRKPKPSAAKPATAANPPAATPGGNQDAPAASTTAAPPSAGGDPATEVATNSEPASSSPIGELTTANTPGQAQRSKETGDLIANTENGLNAIKRQLSSQEMETVAQIRAFLSKAKLALTNQDFDGAYTLATKAKVLFDELNKT